MSHNLLALCAKWLGLKFTMAPRKNSNTNKCLRNGKKGERSGYCEKENVLKLLYLLALETLNGAFIIFYQRKKQVVQLVSN